MCTLTECMQTHVRTVFLAILFHLRNGHLWERDLRLLVGVEFCPPRSDEYAGPRTSQEELIPSYGHTRTVSQTPTA